MARTIIVQPQTLRGEAGWEVWEDPQVCPFFPRRKLAAGYALLRARGGVAALELRDAAGAVVRRLEPAEAAALAQREADRDHAQLAAMSHRTYPGSA